MPRAPFTTLLVGLIAALSAGCAPAPSSEPENGPEPRLAVLSPAMSIILRDLDAEDHIVGRHGYDLILATKPIPVVGNESGLDYEALINVEPDIILLEGNQRGVPERLQALAEQRDWRIENIPLLSLEEVLAAVKTLDNLIHPQSGSEQGRTLTNQLEAAWAYSPAASESLGRTVALASTDPPGILGPGSFHHELLERLGANALPDQGMPYITWSNEDLKLANPDSLVIFAPASTDSIDDLLAPLSRIGLRAIENDRVFVIRHPHCHTPSTALIAVSAELREALGARE